jgi:hypothetical protein
MPLFIGDVTPRTVWEFLCGYNGFDSFQSVSGVLQVASRDQALISFATPAILLNPWATSALIWRRPLGHGTLRTADDTTK